MCWCWCWCWCWTHRRKQLCSVVLFCLHDVAGTTVQSHSRPPNKAKIEKILLAHFQTMGPLQFILESPIFTVSISESVLEISLAGHHSLMPSSAVVGCRWPPFVITQAEEAGHRATLKRGWGKKQQYGGGGCTHRRACRRR